VAAHERCERRNPGQSFTAPSCSQLIAGFQVANIPLRVMLPRIDVEHPQVERRVVQELLPEQGGRGFPRSAYRERDDVLETDEAEPSVLLRLVEDDFRLIHCDFVVHEGRVQQMASHAAVRRVFQADGTRHRMTHQHRVTRRLGLLDPLEGRGRAAQQRELLVQRSSGDSANPATGDGAGISLSGFLAVDRRAGVLTAAAWTASIAMAERPAHLRTSVVADMFTSWLGSILVPLHWFAHIE
jgi:hypothetical protein